MDRRDWFKNTIFGVVGAAIAKPAEAIPEPFVEPLMRTGGVVPGSGNITKFVYPSNVPMTGSGTLGFYPKPYGASVEIDP